MGVRILEGGPEDDYKAVLYDSVSGWAFGPVFTSHDAAERFLAWLRKKVGIDAREARDVDLRVYHKEWLETERRS